MFVVALVVAVRVRGGRHDGIDVVWGLGFAVVALTTLVVSRRRRATSGGSWLITALTCVWGLRLAVAHRPAQPRQAARTRATSTILERAKGNPRRAHGPQGLRAAGA